MAVPADLVRRSISVGGDDDRELALQEHFRRADFTDGLPVIVPTVERVEAFIRDSNFSADQQVGAVPPSFGVATVANVAVNAVMAGARPEDLGIILTAIDAMLDPHFNLAGVQVTTNPAGPLTIVNGPIRHHLGIDSGGHAYSGGNNPNGSIGRAIRFALRNIGGAKGEVDRSFLGLPSKITFCIAENEEASPWEPLHASLGYQASDDVVTVVAPEAIVDSCRATFSVVEPLIGDFAEVMQGCGTNKHTSTGTLLWVMPPFQARLFAKEGWERRSLQERLFQDAKFTVAPHRDIEGGSWSRRRTQDPDGKIHITRSPADILVMVAGRDDPLHATYLPSVQISFACSRRVWTP